MTSSEGRSTGQLHRQCIFVRKRGPHTLARPGAWPLHSRYGVPMARCPVSAPSKGSNIWRARYLRWKVYGRADSTSLPVVDKKVALQRVTEREARLVVDSELSRSRLQCRLFHPTANRRTNLALQLCHLGLLRPKDYILGIIIPPSLPPRSVPCTFHGLWLGCVGLTIIVSLAVGTGWLVGVAFLGGQLST
jgi:hypothetical protein